MPGGKDLGDFDNVAAAAKGKAHEPLDGNEEDVVGKPTNDSDDAGEEKVDGFVVDAEVVADGKGALPVSAKERQNRPPDSFECPTPCCHFDNV